MTMPNHNPFSASTTRVADPSTSFASPKNGPLRLILVALVVVQFLATWRYSWAYLELVRTGASHPFALLLGTIGSFCLYAGAFLSFRPKPSGKTFLLIATVGLGLSAPMWRLPHVWALVAAFGSVLGIVFWWVVRQSSKSVPSQSIANG